MLEQLLPYAGKALLVFFGALGITVGLRITVRFDLNEWSRERRKRKQRAADQANYDYRQIGHASVVLKKGTSEPFFCPTCFDAGKKIPLQQGHFLTRDLFTHYCPSGCNTQLKLQ